MWEPASLPGVPVPTPYMELSHFWCPWVGSTLQHPSYQEENPRSGLAVGAVAESQPSLNLPSLVVLGGKWLTFSQVGGIPTSEREPHWWCTESQTMWQGCSYLKSSVLCYFLPGLLQPQWMTVFGVSFHSH